jgi:hypothetical protein
VAPGECLTGLAWRFGLEEAKTIWEHADNADLRKLRPSPDLLHPGDVLAIPDPPRRVFTLESGKTHRIVIKRPRKQIRLKLKDADDKPMANLPFELTAGSFSRSGTSNGEGLVEAKVPGWVSNATLKIGDLTLPLNVGDLNPIQDTKDEGVSGVQARLTNLGYRLGRIDGVLGPRTQAALRQFQTDQDLEATGEIDDDTIKALLDEHGC